MARAKGHRWWWKHARGGQRGTALHTHIPPQLHPLAWASERAGVPHLEVVGAVAAAAHNLAQPNHIVAEQQLLPVIPALAG